MVTTVDLRPPVKALQDGVVLVRPIDERDAATLEAAASDPAIVRAFGRATSAEEELAFHRRRWREGKAGAFAICLAESMQVGTVLLEARPQRRADIGYWVLPGQRGRGYASRATRLVATWALREANVARVQLWATPDNKASQRVAELSGFCREGCLRDYGEGSDGERVDAVFYSLIPSDIRDTTE